MKNNLRLVFSESFVVLTAALLIFSLMEIIWPGVILAYFNLNYLLIIWFLNGMIILW